MWDTGGNSVLAVRWWKTEDQIKLPAKAV